MKYNPPNSQITSIKKDYRYLISGHYPFKSEIFIDKYPYGDILNCMKRPKTYNITFTVNTDGSATVGEAFVMRKYNQHRSEMSKLNKRQAKTAVRSLAESA